MSLDRNPAAAGGDAHLLVIVSLAAARREGVAQPESALQRDLVGDVRSEEHTSELQSLMRISYAVFCLKKKKNKKTMKSDTSQQKIVRNSARHDRPETVTSI